MLFAIISIIIQVLLVVHCIKTGRQFLWIWVIVLLPIAGPIAYIAVEMLPELFGSRAAKRTARGMKKVLDPHADLRRYESEARMGGNVASTQRYAEELVRQGRHDEAIEQYPQGAHRAVRARSQSDARDRESAVRQGRCVSGAPRRWTI